MLAALSLFYIQILSLRFVVIRNYLILQYKGDGKTYKVLLSEGNGAGGPWASSPSWQADLKTKRNQVEEHRIDFSSFKPSFGGRGSSRQELDKYIFRQLDMKQIGFMLSLKLSNGDPNPVETFGEGIFDFRLEIHEIDLF
jgi:Complex I intermediate-associated protein 30 (CIA30).